MHTSDQLRANLVDAIDALYDAFATYRITHFESLGCYDYGPTEAELAAVRDNPLRNIPTKALSSMEFFGVGWGEWGSESEVKHLLPRLLEVFSLDPALLDSPGSASLFKYKLAGSLRPTQHGPFLGVIWPEPEKQALLAWAHAALSFQLHHKKDVLELVEATLEMGVRGDEIIALWSNVATSLQHTQFVLNWRPVYAQDEVVVAEATKIREWMNSLLE